MARLFGGQVKYKYFGLFLTVVTLALFIATSIQPKLEEKSTRVMTPERQQLNTLTEKFNFLSSAEFKEYLELKDENKKHQKAEQILAKIFLILMANAIIEPPEQQKLWIQEKIEERDVEKKGRVEEKKNEVIVDPYKENKSETSKVHLTDKNANENMPEFEKFGDLFDGRKIISVLDFDVLKEQWLSGKPLDIERELRPIFPEHLEGYQGEYTGEYRFQGETRNIRLFLMPLKKRVDESVYVHFHLFQNDGPISIKTEFMVYHPRSHTQDGGGPCRAIVLNDEEFQIHLIRLKDRSNLLMHLFRYSVESTAKDKYTFIGNVYLTPKTKTKRFYDSRGRY